MFWAYTLLTTPKDDLLPKHYICKTNIGPGIKDIRNGCILIVSVVVVQQLAILAGKSPYALSAEDIQSYILQYYNT